MTDHADTIRRYIDDMESIESGELYVPVEEAHAALDALLAERQQLRDALKAISEVASVAHNGDPWYCENEGVDATKAFAMARAALAGEDTPQ